MMDEIRIFALMNALDHNGKAGMGPVMGKMMASHPELREDPRALSAMIKKILEEVNDMSMDSQAEMLERLGGPIEMDKRERKDPLVDLDGATKGKVRMRFAPGPSGPLHIGHTRAAILNDEYCRRYNGTFILRLEDTNPEKIDPEAYSMIADDLEWLGVDIDEKYIQSERFEKYYEMSEDLIGRGAAYVCTMDIEEWRDLKSRSVPCEERELSPEDQLEKWDRMKEGHYSEGEASLVIKTDLHHKNPAVRDFVGFRIRNSPHPLTGDRYHIYPLYNLSVAIDDHLMGCTHILRGNDHLNNTIRQEYVYRHMGWSLPIFIHYGLVSIPDTLLKTSLIREEILRGNFSGWSDVRLGTVRALANRGFDPDSIRKYWAEVGIKPVDIKFSWETLETMNREIIDESSNRYFFVKDPMNLTIRSDGTLKSKAPIHPGHPERGYRKYELKPVNGVIDVLIPRQETDLLIEGSIIRLKDLVNVKVEDTKKLSGSVCVLSMEDLREKGVPIIEWTPVGSPECFVSMPDGKIIKGKMEPIAKETGTIDRSVQFERFGFCRIAGIDPFRCNFTHK
jgi:glutamyl-tRNA synthetase